MNASRFFGSLKMTKFKLVLDLDSTLVHSSGNMDDYQKLKVFSDPQVVKLRNRVYTFDLIDVVEPPGTGSTTSMWGVYRPHLFEFLTFASTYFSEIVIWSAGQFKYVHAVSDLIFDQIEPKPQIIKTYDDCHHNGTRVHKPLSDLNLNPSQVLCLDDREDTYSLNKRNGILIPVYEPKPTFGSIMSEDISLVQLMCWLSQPGVLKCDDVRKLDKSTIFTTPLDRYQRDLHY